MIGESSGRFPSDFGNQSPEKKQEIFKQRATEVAEGLKNLLQRHGGKYPFDRMDLTTEDGEAIDEARVLFEYDTEDIPPVDVGQGGDYLTDQLKKIGDIWFYREVHRVYEEEEVEYYTIEIDRAKQLLETSINARNRKIQELQDQNKKAQDLLKTL